MTKSDKNQEVKNLIIQDIKHVFNDSSFQSLPIALENAVELLFTTIEYPIGEQELDGLNESLIPCLNGCYLENPSRETLSNSLKILSTSLDALLKKILFLVDYNRYTALVSRRKGLKEFINETNILKNVRIEALYNESDRVNDTYYQSYIYLAYKCRNKIHEAPELSREEMYKYLNAIIVTYIVSIAEYHNQLNQLFLFDSDQINYKNSLVAKV